MIPLLVAAAIAFYATRAPNQRVHEHRCAVCGHAWWHAMPADRLEAHRCRTCGHMQGRVSRYV